MGGTVSPASKTVKYGSTYGSLPTPQKSGYKFEGWYTNQNGGRQITAQTILDTEGNHTLYALWVKDECIVSYNANGGDLSVQGKVVSYGDYYGTLPTPTKSGCAFGGWYTAASGGQKITASTKVTATSDHTIYAHWIVETCIVSFDANGGTVSTSAKVVTYGTDYGSLPTPYKAYHVFAGWYTERNGGQKVISTTTVSRDSNHTLYAHWTPTTGMEAS